MAVFNFVKGFNHGIVFVEKGPAAENKGNHDEEQSDDPGKRS